MQSSSEPSGSPDLRTSRIRPVRLAALHLGVIVLLPVAGALWFRLGFQFPPCMFHRLTGLYCLTCGATRAVSALLRLQIVRSLLLNPVPILLCAFLLHTVIFELFCWARHKEKRFGWGLHWIVCIALTALIYSLLRNIGVCPTPEQAALLG